MGITISPVMMVFLVFMTGFAGFVDSAAGGGGLISLPAYLFAGLPPHYTYATNKFSAACGTTFATASFFKNGAMNVKVGILAAIGSFAGSALGAHIVLLLSDEVLKTARCARRCFIARYIPKPNSALSSNRLLPHATPCPFWLTV